MYPANDLTCPPSYIIIGVEATGLELINLAASGGAEADDVEGVSVAIADWDRTTSVRNQWHTVGLEKGSVLVRYAWREHGATEWTVVSTTGLDVEQALAHRLALAASNCEVEMTFRKRKVDNAMRAHQSIAHLVRRAHRIDALLREQPANISSLITSVRRLAEGESGLHVAEGAPMPVLLPREILTPLLSAAREHVHIALAEIACVTEWAYAVILEGECHLYCCLSSFLLLFMYSS